jgi:integrative and conjugative element protein (TIGR02256 family)
MRRAMSDSSTPSSSSPPVITLAQRASTVMMREAAAARDGCETGGILLGQLHGRHARVVHAGTPGPHAVATPARFVRDLTHAQAFATACHAADGSVWIGEWHTHPHSAPVPSDLDVTTYAQLLNDTDLAFTALVSLIVAPTDAGLVLAGWWATASTIIPAELRSAPETTL